MGKVPTKIENLFSSIPGTRIPKERDLCDMLLYYSVMVELGFPEADGHLCSHIVDQFSRANHQWSTLFQYYGTFGTEIVKSLTLDLTVHVGTNKMREKASLIFHELGWIKGLDTAEEDVILLEVLEDVPHLNDKMIHTFLYNRQLLRLDWWQFFKEDFSLYRPYFGGIYDANNIEQT